MNETKVDRHFYAPLTDKEYIKLRVDVARKGMKLRQWMLEAIMEKLDKIKED